jgi:DNA-directed RNA polymerase subunit RPC12/RpoP
MKNDINISILRIEDSVAVKKRMEDYAIARDLKAREHNQSIIKRLNSENKIIVKCSKCGKEFEYPKNSELQELCSSCLSKA